MVTRLSFGTAGVRARLGDGEDELNPKNVRVVGHAIASYLVFVDPDAPLRGACVAYDGRRESDVFAREVTAVLAGHGFAVRAFEAPCPTPLLAFATRRTDAALGVMITASHNPPEDNGIKVYLRGGAQVVSPHDVEIAARILGCDDADAIPRADLEEARRAGSLTSLGEREVTAYLDAVTALAPPDDRPLPRIAYSALSGVGTAVTRALFARLGVSEVVEVTGQAEPRPDFGGLSAPNPELRPALDELFSLSERAGAGVAFAHDPDADRLAVLVRRADGSMRALTGDEVGALLGSFMLDRYTGEERPLLVSTLVSAGLLEEIAGARGARFERTLTGFKWMASRARALERSESVRFVFGYEEAIGYAFGALGDDKDGIAALSVLVSLLRSLSSEGRTIESELERLARAHALYATRQVTVRADAVRMAELVARLRALSPEHLLGAGASAVDYLARPERADLLVLERPDGARLCVRPSGTEPKLKLYLQARVAVSPSEPLASAEARAAHVLDAIEAATRAYL